MALYPGGTILTFTHAGCQLGGWDNLFLVVSDGFRPTNLRKDIFNYFGETATIAGTFEDDNKYIIASFESFYDATWFKLMEVKVIL